MKVLKELDAIENIIKEEILPIINNVKKLKDENFKIIR